MTRLKKLLLKADPSANSANKNAVIARFRENVDLTTAPNAGRNWMRPAVAAACVCLLLVGSVSTGLAQTAIEYVKEIFFTKEAVELVDVKGQIMFDSRENINPRIDSESIIVYSDEVSLEEAQNAFYTPFKVPQTLPRGLEFNKVDLMGDHKTVNIRYEDSFSNCMNLAIWKGGKTSWLQFYTDEETVLKYTVGDIEVYRYDEFSEKDQSFIFTDGDFFYICSFYLDEPLTDEEFIEMLESMS